jgi:hypothetical protein
MAMAPGPLVYELKANMKGLDRMKIGVKLISMIAKLFKIRVEFSLEEVKK